MLFRYWCIASIPAVILRTLTNGLTSRSWGDGERREVGIQLCTKELWNIVTFEYVKSANNHGESTNEKK